MGVRITGSPPNKNKYRKKASGIVNTTGATSTYTMKVTGLKFKPELVYIEFFGATSNRGGVNTDGLPNCTIGWFVNANTVRYVFPSTFVLGGFDLQVMETAATVYTMQWHAWGW